MSDMLYQCPFCGSHLLSICGGHTYRYMKPAAAGDHYVRCDACKARGPVATGLKSAAAAWSSRAECETKLHQN